MQRIQANNYSIELGGLASSSFSNLLSHKYASAKKIILVDENTHEHCLDVLLKQFSELENAEVIVVSAGEENKVLEVCLQVWETMSEYQISRHDLVINLGGGLVSDMGGFIASVYKRGLDFISIPTSLLAMVDASSGGKTGVDLGSYKNQLGLFANPQAVYVDTNFLSTLPEDELKNGYAEMLKHGLIASQAHWEQLLELNLFLPGADLIAASIAIKNEIVLSDPLEKGRRKLLNFGHTVGHALEGFYLSKDNFPHGLCIAWGMMLETILSFQKGLLNEKNMQLIVQAIQSRYPKLPLMHNQLPAIVTLMQNDKKNKNGAIQCTLLESIGKGKWDVTIDASDLQQAFVYYRENFPSQ